MQFSVFFFFFSVYMHKTSNKWEGEVMDEKEVEVQEKEMVCVILRWQGRLFWLDDYRIRW